MNKTPHTIVDVLEPLGIRSVTMCLKTPIIEKGYGITVRRDDTVANTSQSGIDSQDEHEVASFPAPAA
jgi:hypothetical protein